MDINSGHMDINSGHMDIDSGHKRKPFYLCAPRKHIACGCALTLGKKFSAFSKKIPTNHFFKLNAKNKKK